MRRDEFEHAVRAAGAQLMHRLQRVEELDERVRDRIEARIEAWGSS